VITKATILQGLLNEAVAALSAIDTEYVDVASSILDGFIPSAATALSEATVFYRHYTVKSPIRADIRLGDAIDKRGPQSPIHGAYGPEYRNSDSPIAGILMARDTIWVRFESNEDWVRLRGRIVSHQGLGPELAGRPYQEG